MEEQHIWNLIARKLSGEASVEELHELEKLLRSNSDLHYPIQTVMDVWNSRQVTSVEEVRSAYDRHLDRMRMLQVDFNMITTPGRETSGSSADSGRSWRKTFTWLAVVAFLVTSCILWYEESYKNLILPMNPETEAKTNPEISTKNGSRTNVLLPDGTTVWLNASSKLSYDKQYGKTLREVFLSGEAFFDVVKNKEKPFIIHAGKIDIRVLGTAFNVKSYPGEKTIETSLIRGSIEVIFKDRPLEKVILKPNEKLVVANVEATSVSSRSMAAMPENGQLVAISHLNYAKKDSTVIETAWVQNKLFFQDQSFRDLAGLMERWYGVRIHLDGSTVDNLHFTGSFENETVQQALEALKLTAKFNYRIEGTQISISQ